MINTEYGKMTVKDLIEKLQNFDENKKVIFRDSEGFYNDLTQFCLNEDTDDNDNYFNGMVCLSMY